MDDGGGAPPPLPAKNRGQGAAADVAPQRPARVAKALSRDRVARRMFEGADDRVNSNSPAQEPRLKRGRAQTTGPLRSEGSPALPTRPREKRRNSVGGGVGQHAAAPAPLPSKKPNQAEEPAAVATDYDGSFNPFVDSDAEEVNQAEEQDVAPPQLPPKLPPKTRSSSSPPAARSRPRQAASEPPQSSVAPKRPLPKTSQLPQRRADLPKSASGASTRKQGGGKKKNSSPWGFASLLIPGVGVGPMRVKPTATTDTDGNTKLGVGSTASVGRGPVRVRARGPGASVNQDGDVSVRDKVDVGTHAKVGRGPVQVRASGPGASVDRHGDVETRERVNVSTHASAGVGPVGARARGPGASFDRDGVEVREKVDVGTTAGAGIGPVAAHARGPGASMSSDGVEVREQIDVGTSARVQRGPVAARARGPGAYIKRHGVEVRDRVDVTTSAKVQRGPVVARARGPEASVSPSHVEVCDRVGVSTSAQVRAGPVAARARGPVASISSEAHPETSEPEFHPSNPFAFSSSEDECVEPVEEHDVATTDNLPPALPIKPSLPANLEDPTVASQSTGRLNSKGITALLRHVDAFAHTVTGRPRSVAALSLALFGDDLPSVSVTDAAAVLDLPVSAVSERDARQLACLRATHAWVTRNVRYDVARFATYVTGKMRPQSVSDTLRLCRGVCGDFAAFVKEIGERAGISVRVVNGERRTTEEINALGGFDAKLRSSPHAWNVVELAGLWYPLDSTALIDEYKSFAPGGIQGYYTGSAFDDFLPSFQRFNLARRAERPGDDFLPRPSLAKWHSQPHFYGDSDIQLLTHKEYDVRAGAGELLRMEFLAATNDFVSVSHAPFGQSPSTSYYAERHPADHKVSCRSVVDVPVPLEPGNYKLVVCRSNSATLVPGAVPSLESMLCTEDVGVAILEYNMTVVESPDPEMNAVGIYDQFYPSAAAAGFAVLEPRHALRVGARNHIVMQLGTAIKKVGIALPGMPMESTHSPNSDGIVVADIEVNEFASVLRVFGSTDPGESEYFFLCDLCARR